MESGQTLMDLGGAEGEDLFNRTRFRRNKDTVASKKTLFPRNSPVTPAEDSAYMDAVKRGTEYANARTEKLAPNGKRSNLSNALYHLVRTERFKKWFGDWEKVLLQKFLEGTPVASARGDEYLNVNDNDVLRDLIYDGYKRVNWRVKNPHIGIVELTKSGIRDSISKGLGRAKIAAFDYIPEIIENGMVVNDESNWKGRGYDTSVITAPISIGGKQYAAFVVVRKHSNGNNNFYLHEVGLIEDIKNETERLRTGSSDDSALSRPFGSVKSIALSIFSVNADSVSKIIDENGEPLVVYHSVGSWYVRDGSGGFTKFDGAIAKDGFMFRGSKDWVGPDGWGARNNNGKGEFKTVFLDIKNPLIVDASGANYTRIPNPLIGYLGNENGIAELVSENKRAIGELRRDESPDASLKRSKLLHTWEYFSRMNGKYVLPDAMIHVMHNMTDDNFNEFDGVIIKNVDEGEKDGVGDDYITDNPYAIKSADPVTYDDDDNVIPLSERFNAEKSDIRWRRRSFREDAIVSNIRQNLKHGNVYNPDDSYHFAYSASQNEIAFYHDNGDLTFDIIIRRPLTEDGISEVEDYARYYKNDENGEDFDTSLQEARSILRRGGLDNIDRIENGVAKGEDGGVDVGHKNDGRSDANSQVPENSGYIRFRRVTDKNEIDRLNNDQNGYTTAYASAQIIDGKIYSPMAAYVDNKLTDPFVIGEWQKAEEHPELNNGGKFNLEKNTKSSDDVTAAYNPYWHSVSMDSPLNDQFSTAYRRPNLVMIEVRIPNSDLRSGYRAEGAADPVGPKKWKNGQMTDALIAAGKPRRVVFLSRYRQVVRVLSNEESAGLIAKQLDGVDIKLPANVVSPSVRDILTSKYGIKLGKPTGNAKQVAKYTRELKKQGVMWRRNRPYSPNVNAQRLADVYKLTSAESRAYVKMQRMLGADDYQSLVKAVREVQIQGSVNAENRGLLDAINNGDKTKVLDDLKRGTESVIVRNGKKFLKIKLQDAMTSVKQMEDALGIKKEDSVYYQFDRNYGLEQEHLDALNREVMVPLRDEMAALEKKHNRKIKSHKIVTKNGVATQQEEYHEETAYGLLNMLLMAKHGPNRNRMMAERSPYVLEAMTNKATKQIIDDVLNGVRDLDEATVKQIAANLGWSGEKLTRLEKGLSGSGASTAFWNKWMKDHAQFAADADKARRLVLKMNQMTRDVLVKSGRMSAAQAKEWGRLSPDYVPLRSDMDVDSSIFAKLFLGGNGSGVSSGAEGHKYTDNEFHHAFGRNDIADDAIAFSQQQYMEAVKRALDNDARRKLAATVRKNPNLGNVIMLLSEAERADIAKRVAILKNTFQKRGLTPQELDALVKMTRKLAEDRIGQGFIPTQRILGANGVYYDIPNVKGLERNEKNKNDTRTPFIAFKEDGELKFIMLGGFSQREINANPALLSDSDAKEIATQVKKQNLFRSNFASGLRKWTGWFSAMRTAYSPYFMATNLLADRSQAKRNIDATFGSEGVKKFRHYAFNSFGAARAVLDYKKIVDPATGETRYERVFDNNSNVQKYAKEWAENGGRIAGMAIENIRELRDGIRYNIRNAGSVKDRWNRTDVKDPKSMLAFLNDMRVRGSDVVEYANSVVEMSTRIAAYATARDMGMSIADAVSYSRDVTVNFNRKGELTPFINALWAFSNASIQDFSRSMEAFGEGEYVKGSLILGKRGAKMALKLAIWGFLASLVGIVQDDPEDEAEGEKQYKYNKEWEKANKMGVRIGDFTVGVPIRGLSRVPYYFGQKMAEVMFTNKRTTSAALDVAKLVFDTGYDVVGGSPTLAQAISPSVMKPLVELWENKDFTGKQIYTEDVFGKGFAKSEMGRSSTSDEAKAVARFVNWITGGDRGKSGKIDLHPEVYEKLLDWAGGTAMRDVAQTAGFVKDLATFNIANRNVRNMPLVSRFIRSVGENSSDFYEKRAEYDKAKTHHAKMADIGDAESMREDENEMPWLSKRGSGKRWGDALKDKESEIKKLLKAEKTLEGEDKELAHKLRLKSQYQFMRRLETAPKDDAEGVKAERDHKRAAMPLIRKATKMLEDAERKRKRLERGL